MATSDFYQPDCVCDETVKLYKNRTRTLELTIVTDLGDITGALIWFSIKKVITDEDVDALVTKLSDGIPGGSDAQAKVVDGPNRVIEIYLDPADTVDISAGSYVSDAVIQLLSGEKYQLKEPFRFALEQPVTLAV